jgi:hypothetical protein
MPTSAPYSDPDCQAASVEPLAKGSYPQPIVNHEVARERVLAAYAKVRNP